MTSNRLTAAAALLAALTLSATPHSTAHADPPGGPTEIQRRIDAATADATGRGAAVQIAYLDRGARYWAGNAAARVAVPSASVTKVFIADNLLFRQSHGQPALGPAERGALSAMLRSSDDGAAERFWDRFGGTAMIADVIGRYRLATVSPRREWFNTLISPADMVDYYSRLLDGAGGLAPTDRDFLLGELRAATRHGTDGFNQEFGLPHGLWREPVRGVKQGWMIDAGNHWLHNSTGVIEPDGRYVVAVFVQEPARLGERHSRDTIDRVATLMFPDGTAAQPPIDVAREQLGAGSSG